MGRNIFYYILLILICLSCQSSENRVALGIINESFDSNFTNRDIGNIIFYENWLGPSYAREISIDIVLELDSNYNTNTMFMSKNYWGLNNLLDYPVDLPSFGSYHEKLKEEAHIFVDLKDSLIVDMGKDTVKVGTDYTICILTKDLNKLYLYSYVQ